MGNFLLSLFSGPAGEISSKRVAALILIIAGIIYAFTRPDASMCAILIGSGCGLLGVQAITKT